MNYELDEYRHEDEEEGAGKRNSSAYIEYSYQTHWTWGRDDRGIGTAIETGWEETEMKFFFFFFEKKTMNGVGKVEKMNRNLRNKRLDQRELPLLANATTEEDRMTVERSRTRGE